MPWLEQLDSKGGRVELFELVQDVVRVGRDPASEILIVRPFIGRRPLRLVGKGDGYLLEVQATRSSVLVNKRRIQEGAQVELNDGDRIQVDAVGFIYRTKA